MNQIQEIPVSKIKVGDYEVRLDQDDEEIDDLCASIRRMGIIVPLHVTVLDDGYKLVAGHRRIRAAKKTGLAAVPCILLDSDSDNELEVSIAENLFRKDLSAVETSAIINDLISEEKYTVEVISKMMHKSENWVRNTATIINWPELIQMAVHTGKLSVSAAQNLALVENEKYRDFLVGHAVNNGATARTTAAWLQEWRANKPVEQAIEAQPVDGQTPQKPLIPQAPCIVCKNVFRTDELCHVPLCASCIRITSEAGRS